MKRKNLFDGESYKAQFVRITYRRLMNDRQWVTYADVMADSMSCSKENLPANLSNCNYYGALKKAFSEVCNAIKERVGNDSIENEGNNRNKRFRYTGKAKDPLADMRNAKVVNNLRQYWKFCQDSAGFFPKSWLEYFFKDCQDLLDMKVKRQKGEQVINASLDRILTNMEYLPSLYEAITNKMVLEIDYKPYDEEQVTLTFHPHYLKEYNGRWHLFGHAEGREPEYGYNLALDRIRSKPREREKISYKKAPNRFYEEYFNDIVGVSHYQGAEKKHIIIRAHTLKMYKLMDTKRLHSTYHTVTPYGRHEDGEYAEFSVDVEVNNEFIGSILQMGDGLEVMAPKDVRAIFVQRVLQMHSRYSGGDVMETPDNLS
ncbi:MAG: WYL domain-containing protein [Bacteroidales bacterium]|nr:WYL domain-containing protein [Bacteroidales bacterium]MCM1146401.1 WYL domain-containing protein [Bacteroidales bacterium]MCM1205161.1 WYL domain-containing protein [Bacillota bacterium]MCM1509408.1 WYL domain-containing protein [Clostridium sp.]